MIHFEYDTLQEVKIESPDDVPQPGFSACFRVIDIINVTKAKQEYNMTIKRYGDLGFSYDKFSDYLDVLTVSDLFKLTPSNEDLLQYDEVSCYVRLPGNTIRSKFSGHECLKIFKLNKYIHREFICYQYLMDIGTSKLNELNNVLSRDYYGQVLKFYLNSKILENVKVFVGYVHEQQSVHLYDSMKSTLFEFVKNNDENLHPEIRMMYGRAEIYSLKSPYVTDCVDYGVYMTAYNYMLSKMNDKTIKNFGKCIVDMFIFNSSKCYIMTVRDYQNNTITNKLESWNMKELKSSCHYLKIITRAEMYTSNYLSYSIFWPNDLTTTVTHIPQQSTIDFIIYICSSIGIWLGISFYSMTNFLKEKISRTEYDIKDEKYSKLNKKFVLLQCEVLHIKRLFNSQLSYLKDKLLSFEN